MMDSSDEYEVEKILKKRMKNGKIEYRLKWANFPSSENKWIPLEQMNCPDLLKDFEKSRLKFIVGVALLESGKIAYAIKFKDCQSLELIESDEAFQNWPNELIDFLENAVVFQMPVSSGETNELVVNNSMVGLPKAIIGCTDLGDEWRYLCQWVNEDQKIITAADAKKGIPRLVISYLEEKLELTQGNQLLSKYIHITRSIKNWAIENDVLFDPVVKIERNLDMEKYLLKKPAGKIISRRLTTGAALIPKTTKQIPFGARGRKRQTINLVNIGIQPNPDGRKLVQSNQVSSTLVQVDPVPNTTIQASRRTYARASSTPLPPSSAPCFEHTTIPFFNLTPSADIENVTIDLDMDDSIIGNLHYSGSE
ncbi:uncharacterized protein LOC116347737 [Contarinia nasturtii]|uniref:uncharacterized protein LOC116347737 n=1 Tax=Contarinia nasturtii TaxID=265458 RepID=UPI0012D40853|nr:uncharacterized protein LOC116347737 [Contarinia nasturtii]